MTTETQPAFLTVPDAARRLGVSTRTAYRLIADEDLPAVELRGLMRIPTRALDAWIGQQEKRSRPIDDNDHPKVAAAHGLGTQDGSDVIGAQEFLSRTDLGRMGFPRRAIDSIFGNVPVVALPGYSRPFIRRADFETFLEQHTYDETRVRL